MTFYSNVGQFIQLRPKLAAPTQPIRAADGSLIDFPALAALPTTFLIDPHGDVLAYVPGAAEWQSAQAPAR